MDGAGHAVLELEVHFGDSVFGEHGGVGDITCKKRLGSATAADCAATNIPSKENHKALL